MDTDGLRSFHITFWLGIASLLLNLVLLRWMLASRTAVKGTGTARLASSAACCHRPSRHWTPPRETYTLPYRVPVRRASTMLRNAAQKYEQENRNETVLGKTLSQSLFPDSSPPPAPQQPSSKVSSVSAGFRNNALKPSPPSAWNPPFQKPQPRQQGGVKRTASGLAKACDGSFEDDRGSANRPIVLNGQSPAKKEIPQVQQTELFDEDDFDSDIDLDFEEPKSRGNVKYPSLPKQANTSNAPAKPVVYPTLPRQAQVHTGYQHSGYGSMEPSTEQVPASSAQLPWSSSPVEHMQPSRDVSEIRRFAYPGEMTEQARQNGPPQPPAKRRTLPWLNGDEETTSGGTSISNAMRTPASKQDKKSSFPWNTTASAIKDQQKKHREEVKKAVKKNEGTEESISKAKSKRKQVARVFLSEEQQQVLNLVVEEKKSVFFTGSAGTGKSVLLREIISSLRKKYVREPDRVAVTASTGLAACNVGGVTLHSFAGIGLGKEDATELVRKIKRNQKAKHRWMRTKVLIIDEVSMVDGELFDKLESVARQLRNNGRPFGGIQLVITGDFFQLPPVPDSGRVAKFAFDAGTWNTAVEHVIGLHHVFRQKDPGKFLRHLYI